MRLVKRILIPTLLLLSACEAPQATTKEKAATPSANPEPPKPAAAKQPMPVQRFIPISSNVTIVYGVPSPFLALDTMTGILCKTWDFSWEHPTPGQKTLQDLLTCESLSSYEEDPLHLLGPERRKTVEQT